MMNKILTGLLLMSFFLGFSQEKKITFNKKLNYQFVEKRKTTDFVMYSSQNNETLTQIDNRGFPMMFYADKLGMSGVNFDMNNRLTDASLMGGFLGHDPYGSKTELDVTYEKLSNKENIAEISCQNYLISLKRNDEEEIRENDKIKVCIDEKNEINNVPVLFKLLDQFSRSKTNNINLKGLILKAGPSDNYDKEYAILKSSKNVQDFVYFDHPKSLLNQQKRADSLFAEYKKQEAEYENYAVDSAAVVVDSAATAVIDAAGYEDDSYIPEYESTYKKPASEEANLAIDNITNQEIWKGLPKHCNKIEDNLPKLDNKEFKKHLHNYVGQMCDMYLTQGEYHSVGIKITLDEIRREVLYINENKEKLSKPDQKKLSQYLENLD